MMAGTSVELTAIGLSEPASTAKTTNLRRPSQASQARPASTISSLNSAEAVQDEISSHQLERTLTITSKSRTAAIITSTTLVTVIGSLTSGLTTVALPTMVRDLDIPGALELWPNSMQALTTGCTLLFSGTIADALGPRLVYLIGAVLQGGFILGCGLARSAADLIIMRALSGIATSLCLPSAVSIITGSFAGQRRNMAFAAMGGGQPIGFSIGLALGGVLTDTIGWRWGYYLAAILTVIVLAVAVWGLPKEIDQPTVEDGAAPQTGWSYRLQRLKTEIDWVGAMIASASLALISYVFASLTGNTSSIKRPATIALLSLSLALVPVFVFWVGRQENLGRPAIIPNSLWRNRSFSSICLAVFLTWGSFNALETILTFYFQRVQNLSAMQSSVRFLPAPVSGAVSNLLMGLLVHRIKANYLVLGGCLLSFIAPLVMVPAGPSSNYWTTAFLANIFNPTGADSLFTIANLLITSVFPAKTQALAGGVFNTISQIGKAVGLALVAVIASSVTAESTFVDKTSPEALNAGYRATWWYVFAAIMVTVAICLWGLRSIGRVGHKRD